MEAFFSAVNNPSRNEYEAAHVALAINSIEIFEVPDMKLCLNTFKKALRSPAAYSPNPYDETTQKSEYLGVDMIWWVLPLIEQEYLYGIIQPMQFYGIVKWGINIPKFINDFEQRYGKSISTQEVMKQYAYATGVFIHDLLKYLQARGIAISPQDLRDAYRKYSTFTSVHTWDEYYASIKPKIDDDEAHSCIWKLKGFVQQTKQNYRRNVAIPLGIKLPD